MGASTTSARPNHTKPAIDTMPDAFGLVSEQAIAAMLRRDERTLQRWQAERRGPPFIMVGKERRYNPDSVKQWLFASEQQPIRRRAVRRV
jgi:hypothetical protein